MVRRTLLRLLVAPLYNKEQFGGMFYPRVRARLIVPVPQLLKPQLPSPKVPPLPLLIFRTIFSIRKIAIYCAHPSDFYVEGAKSDGDKLNFVPSVCIRRTFGSKGNFSLKIRFLRYTRGCGGGFSVPRENG